MGMAYGAKKIYPYYEDYKPVERRINNVKIAGWSLSEKSGQSAEWENTYNDFIEGIISGVSVQDGTPTPDTPVDVVSAGGEVASRGQDPYRDISSISLPDLRAVNDVSDTLEYMEGGMWKLMQRIAVKVLNGTESWEKYASNPTQNVYFITISGAALGFQTSVCSHFINVNSSWGAVYGSFGKYSDHGTIVGRKYFNMGSECPDVNDFKAWLAAQYAAGTPVTVHYQLATPVMAQLNLGELRSFPRSTVVEQSGEVKANLTLKAKAMD